MTAEEVQELGSEAVKLEFGKKFTKEDRAPFKNNRFKNKEGIQNA
jgi:hypothetical protein